MWYSVRRKQIIWQVLSFGAAALLALGLAGSAQAALTAGILPPANPASDCDHTSSVSGYWGVANIDACRALEGVGPLVLPSNWADLTPVQQGFVLINLERVNRGMAPVVGLSASLDRLAAQAAAGQTDPSFPTGDFLGGGGIWAGASSILSADYLWMYDDGPNGFDSNMACPTAGAPGCWGHRDIILWNRTGGTLVAGGGSSTAGGSGSFAYLVLAGYSTAGLTFTWAAELPYFARPPGVEATGRTAAAVRRLRRRAHRRTHRHHHRHAGAGGGPSITFG